MSIMDGEKETRQFLLAVKNEEDQAVDFNDWRYEKASFQKKYFRRFAIIQVVLLSLYGMVAVLLFHQLPSLRASGRDGEEFVYTPAISVDKFSKTMMNMHLYKDNPYKGPPSPQLDDAWAKLFEHAYIRLSREELDKLGSDSVPIPDGSGDYFGALDVYHQLHCVRFIFEYVNQDYYTLRKINVPASDHINHCIDVLRQVVMCLGDTSISTMSFHSDYPRAWPEFKFEHSCRNWEAVDAWAGMPGRVVDQSDRTRLEAWLQNPNFDKSTKPGHFFDGHGEAASDH